MASISTAQEVADKAPGMDHRPDLKLLEGHIQDAEERLVKPFLGVDWYEAMVTAAAGNGGSTLTGANLAFWNAYLHRMCAVAVLHDALPFIYVRVGNKGVMQMAGEFANIADTSDVKLMQSALKERLRGIQRSADEWLRDTSRASSYTTYPGNGHTSEDCDEDSGTQLDDYCGVVL